jgi:hypothetical protein
MGVQDQIQAAGSMGMSVRPKPRFIDKILMRNRDQKAQELAANQPMQPGMQPSGPAMMGSGPGTNIFGGQGAFNRPNTMAMMLGGGGR